MRRSEDRRIRTMASAFKVFARQIDDEGLRCIILQCRALEDGRKRGEDECWYRRDVVVLGTMAAQRRQVIWLRFAGMAVANGTALASKVDRDREAVSTGAGHVEGLKAALGATLDGR
jgi:hypothetical protein